MLHLRSTHDADLQSFAYIAVIIDNMKTQGINQQGEYSMETRKFVQLFFVSGLIVTLGVPVQYKLYNNYPNPFNPSTTINYVLPENGNVKLLVYDVLGNEVAVLVNEEKTFGSYEIKYDASKLSSGIYFYEIRAGEIVDTKKMVLMK